MSAPYQRLGGCLLAVAALSIASLASAQEASSSASLTGFSWKLIDLDLEDGITPALTVRSTATATWSQRIGGPSPDIDWQPTYTSTEIVNVTGSAHTWIDPHSSYARAEASNLTSAFQAYNSDSFVFDITPMTELRFTGLAAVDSTETGSWRTFGYVEIGGALYNSVAVPIPPNAVRIGSFNVSVDTMNGPGSEFLTGVLRSGEQAAAGSVHLYSRAGVNLAPVPEPSTWAMLLAGLGLLGWRGRHSLS